MHFCMQGSVNAQAAVQAAMAQAGVKTSLLMARVRTASKKNPPEVMAAGTSATDCKSEVPLKAVNAR